MKKANLLRKDDTQFNETALSYIAKLVASGTEETCPNATLSITSKLFGALTVTRVMRSLSETTQKNRHYHL
jgi:hypothetical protein